MIETRKDQIAGLGYTVRARKPAVAADAGPRIESVLAFLARPDRRHSFAAWLRMWLEDMLVIDAACLYPRFTRGGDLYSVDVIDGSTITPLVAEDGRSPEPPDPAYQQVLHGVPAADFSSDELLYLPRNPRPHRLYGMSPVEQVALSVNIALRRDAATLDYYRVGSTPDAFATLPKEWTLDQVRQFQDYFDALMSGNLGRRRMVKFMPSGFELKETRQPPLKDQYDEWLARIICYAFSVPASAFVSQVNRATSETLARPGRAGRPGSAEGLGEERARRDRPGPSQTTRSRIHLGRRRRGRSAATGADAQHPRQRRDQDARGGEGGAGAGAGAGGGGQRRAGSGSSIRITIGADGSRRRKTPAAARNRRLTEQANRRPRRK